MLDPRNKKQIIETFLYCIDSFKEKRERLRSFPFLLSDIKHYQAFVMIFRTCPTFKLLASLILFIFIIS